MVGQIFLLSAFLKVSKVSEVKGEAPKYGRRILPPIVSDKENLSDAQIQH